MRRPACRRPRPLARGVLSCVVLASLVAVGPAAWAGASGVVFASQDVPVEVAPGTSATSALKIVAGDGLGVVDLDVVAMGIDSDRPGGLRATLASPSGLVTELFSGACPGS